MRAILARETAAAENGERTPTKITLEKKAKEEAAVLAAKIKAEIE
jgi:hypothetical protein